MAILLYYNDLRKPYFVIEIPPTYLKPNIRSHRINRLSCPADWMNGSEIELKDSEERAEERAEERMNLLNQPTDHQAQGQGQGNQAEEQEVQKVP
jgi:hypothetical protein